MRWSKVRPGGGVDGLAAELGLEDEGLDPPLGVDAAEDPAGDDRDDQSGADVDGGDLPAEQAEQHADGDLVDHRAGDEEAHRDAERDAGGDEADERRHGAARAERGDDAEPGGHDVADALALAAEQGAGPLDAHVGAQHGDDEDDPDQQQGDLRGVVEEEVDRLGEAVGGVQPERAVEEPVPEVLVQRVQPDPRDSRADEGEDLAAAGGRDAIDDLGHERLPAGYSMNV